MIGKSTDSRMTTQQWWTAGRNGNGQREVNSTAMDSALATQRRCSHCNTNNPTLGISSHTFLHMTSDQSQMRQHKNKGSSGSSPLPNIFLFFYVLVGTHNKNSQKKGWTTDWPRHHFCHPPFSHPAPPNPLPQRFRSLHQSNCRFWQRDGITHVAANKRHCQIWQ